MEPLLDWDIQIGFSNGVVVVLERWKWSDRQIATNSLVLWSMVVGEAIWHEGERIAGVVRHDGGKKFTVWKEEVLLLSLAVVELYYGCCFWLAIRWSYVAISELCRLG
jgi:hypothetical protein